MALMGDLFAEQPITPAGITYPVVVTTYDNASVKINNLNFADVSYTDNNMAEGLQYMKECLHEMTLTEYNSSLMLPIAPASLSANQMMLLLLP